jgi:hypothetical protein
MVIDCYGFLVRCRLFGMEPASIDSINLKFCSNRRFFLLFVVSFFYYYSLFLYSIHLIVVIYRIVVVSVPLARVDIDYVLASLTFHISFFVTVVRGSVFTDDIISFGFAAETSAIEWTLLSQPTKHDRIFESRTVF